MSDGYDWQVYALRARDDGPVRYIGVSKDAHERFKQHRKDARRGSASPVHQWLLQELAANGAPVCEVLDSGQGIDAAGHAERKWIAHYRKQGIDSGHSEQLLNAGLGGEFLNDIQAFKHRLAYVPPNKLTERHRMFRDRIWDIVLERGDGRPDGNRAFDCALRALTCARAGEMDGDSLVLEHTVKLLLQSRYAERTVNQARARVTDEAVRKTLAGAVEANEASQLQRQQHMDALHRGVQMSLLFSSGGGDL
jgi:hypothetical protein